VKFAGQFERPVDDKGRLVLPSRLREGLGGQQTLITDLGDRLAIWPEAAFESYVDGLKNALRGEISGAELNEATGFLWASAQPIRPDSQGRIVIPDDLLTAEMRGQSIWVCGNDHRIDLWTQANWAEHKERGRGHVTTAIAGYVP
jgi:MraZ protein